MPSRPARDRGAFAEEETAVRPTCVAWSSTVSAAGFTDVAPTVAKRTSLCMARVRASNTSSAVDRSSLGDVGLMPGVACPFAVGYGGGCRAQHMQARASYTGGHRGGGGGHAPAFLAGQLHALRPLRFVICEGDGTRTDSAPFAQPMRRAPSQTAGFRIRQHQRRKVPANRGRDVLVARAKVTGGERRASRAYAAAFHAPAPTLPAGRCFEAFHALPRLLCTRHDDGARLRGGTGIRIFICKRWHDSVAQSAGREQDCTSDP